MSRPPITDLRARPLWLSLVGIPIGFSNEAMELTTGDPLLDPPEASSWWWTPFREPRAFITPGTFGLPEKTTNRAGIPVWESYNLRSITMAAPPLPVLLQKVGLCDAMGAVYSAGRDLLLPDNGLHLVPEPPSPAGHEQLLRFPVGSLLLRDFVEPMGHGVWDLVPQDLALVATAAPRFTAPGWKRRAFHYENPESVFSPSAVVYRDQLDQVAFVEEFVAVGEAVVVERFALSA